MHEVGLAAEVLAIATDRAAGRQVRKVTVEVGQLTAVLPDALRFAFELLRDDNGLPGAELELVIVPARARCRSCGAVTERSEPFAWCACGGFDLEWLAGAEPRVLALEVV